MTALEALRKGDIDEAAKCLDLAMDMLDTAYSCLTDGRSLFTEQTGASRAR